MNALYTILMFSHVFTAATYLFFAAFAALAVFLAGVFLPPSIGYQVRIVQTGSMEPAIPVGAVVVVRPADAYRVGDVITYQRIGDAEATTHRIVADEVIAGVLSYSVQGDANNAPDAAPVREHEVLGKVWFSVPYLGYVLDFVRQPLGFFLIIGVPALAILGEEVVKIRRAVRQGRAQQQPDEHTAV